MQIPPYERVIYKRNPLNSVTCQLTFPAILSIDAKVPNEFQDSIRAQYPEYNELRGLSATLGPQPGQPNLPIRLGNATYQFIAGEPNELWVVSLNQSSISLSTTHYVKWEDFLEHLENPLKMLLRIYSPYCFSRIGLRYQNAIYRSKLGLAEAQWKDLLHPHIASIFNVTDDDADVEANYTQATVRLGTDRKVLMNFGLGHDPVAKESLYVIDNDFFSEKRIEVNDATTILNSLHGESGRLFRWCVSDKLHDALEPGPA